MYSQCSSSTCFEGQLCFEIRKRKEYIQIQLRIRAAMRTPDSTRLLRCGCIYAHRDPHTRVATQHATEASVRRGCTTRSLRECASTRQTDRYVVRAREVDAGIDAESALPLQNAQRELRAAFSFPLTCRASFTSPTTAPAHCSPPPRATRLALLRRSRAPRGVAARSRTASRRLEDAVEGTRHMHRPTSRTCARSRCGDPTRLTRLRRFGGRVCGVDTARERRHAVVASTRSAQRIRVEATTERHVPRAPPCLVPVDRPARARGG
ncbi:hypothetical protein MSAN_01650400 [Mycena sanguinolenta]|uniref:Uncharacterized protein n=1 Tax=Mycena sanguinolenta TaxID=230812 RepID=A0A8H6XYW7_9AGAR|nr:hypothetical protein MSAN_01650400 [Mycena sanguinolenta]